MRAMQMAVCVSVVAALCVSFVWAQEAEKKLIGAWRFDEGEGLVVKDSSGCGKDGAISNKGRGVTWVEGRTGKAVQFIGGDPAQRNVAGCVEIPRMDDTDYGKGVTVECWVKFNELVRERTYEIISNTVSDRGPGFRLRVTYLQLQFASGEGGTGKSWAASSSPATAKLEPNVWYHVAGTYDGAIFRVYLDGKEVGATKEPQPLTKGRAAISIGAYVNGYAYGLDGVVDEAKVYNYARSAAEILQDATAAE